MVIIDLPVSWCVRCVRRGEIDTPTSPGIRGQACKYLERVHVDTAGPISVASARGREYVSVEGDYTRAVYTRPPRLKSDAIEAVKAFWATAENEFGKGIWEIMMGEMHGLLMGKLRDGIKLHTTVPHHPTS